MDTSGTAQFGISCMFYPDRPGVSVYTSCMIRSDADRAMWFAGATANTQTNDSRLAVGH